MLEKVFAFMFYKMLYGTYNYDDDNVSDQTQKNCLTIITFNLVPSIVRTKRPIIIYTIFE